MDPQVGKKDAQDSATTPLQAYDVSVLPELISQPAQKEMRAAYPQEAREKGLEANVYLKVLVSSDGWVERIRVVKSAGEQFDRVALRFVKRYRFRPGRQAGRPIAVWLPWTYKFRLAD
jgi:protein TonB